MINLEKIKNVDCECLGSDDDDIDGHGSIKKRRNDGNDQLITFTNKRNRMPHHKSPPRSLNLARNQVGITFSFHLKEMSSTDPGVVQEAKSITDSPQSQSNRNITDSPQSQYERPQFSGGDSNDEDTLKEKQPSANQFMGYQLEPAIKTVSCITLMRKINKRLNGARGRGGIGGQRRRNSVGSIASSTATGISKKFSQNPSKKSSQSPFKKRKPGQGNAMFGECIWCGIHKTAQWRRGPIGARSLCNVL